MKTLVAWQKVLPGQKYREDISTEVAKRSEDNFWETTKIKFLRNLKNFRHSRLDKSDELVNHVSKSTYPSGKIKLRQPVTLMLIKTHLNFSER